MYHSWAVEDRDSQRWALSKGQLAQRGHKSLEIENYGPEPSLGVTLGAGAKAAKARRVGWPGICSDSLTRMLSPHLLAEVMWPYTDPPDMRISLRSLFAFCPCGSASGEPPSPLAREGRSLPSIIQRGGGCARI